MMFYSLTWNFDDIPLLDHLFLFFVIKNYDKKYDINIKN